MFISETTATSISERLIKTLTVLRASISDFVEQHRELINAIVPQYQASARNLLAYTALRQQDLHTLQLELAQYGLSSLGRIESHVLHGLDQVLQRLSCIEPHQSKVRPAPVTEAIPLNWLQAESLLHLHTYGLLGPRPHDRHIFIMVTAPDEVPSPEWFKQLLSAGMNVLRINTAHGDLKTWIQTASIARDTAHAMQLELKIMVDFAGQKIRLAPFAPGPNILKLKPRMDRLGMVTENLRVTLLGPEQSDTRVLQPALVIPAEIVGQLSLHDTLHFTDSRGRKRRLTVCAVSANSAIAEIDRTAYLDNHTTICWQRQDQEMGQFLPATIPALEDYAELGAGDNFELVFDNTRPSTRTQLVVPPGPVKITVSPGQRVILDDGKVDAVIDNVTDNVMHCRVLRAVKRKVKIRGDKGVSFFADAIDAPVLSDDDLAVLPHIVQFADLVGISFVRTAADIAEVHRILSHHKPHAGPGMVIKIETGLAVENLPRILLQAMQRYPAGVMIARGDLATEIGYERMAEIQQEILWFCEAAHLPVIWATQVLENLAHTGIPTRAEVTDAASAVQAECVMLNKGEHIHEACRTLHDIICKMEKHQYKKRSLYRALRISMGDWTRQIASD